MKPVVGRVVLGLGHHAPPGAFPPQKVRFKKPFDKKAFENLVDETIRVAMDLGAMRAPDGILKLTDRLQELRQEVLNRGGDA